MAKRHGGTLPNVKWLYHNGFSGLTRAIREHPDAFAHIRQNTLDARRKKLVQCAKRLAIRHQGTIPSMTWLLRSGYSSLRWAIPKYPKLFASIRIGNDRGKSAEQWLPVAQRLAKKHGCLPSISWLQDNGYCGLVYAIYKCPEIFAHLTRVFRRKKKPAEWVPIAEQLAQEHGELPNPKWLVSNGYNGLQQAMRIHPNLFRGIIDKYGQRLYRTKTPKEWLLIAKRLTRQHNRLPNYRWLEENGFGGLNHAMRKHSSLFASIEQEYKGGRKPKEWIPVAKKLIKIHSVLPNSRWLRRNGYAGLEQAMRNYPQLFTGIKRKRK